VLLDVPPASSRHIQQVWLVGVADQRTTQACACERQEEVFQSGLAEHAVLRSHEAVVGYPGVENEAARDPCALLLRRACRRNLLCSFVVRP
jgi:hypothetical protein